MWCWNELGLEKVMWSPSGRVGFLWVTLVSSHTKRPHKRGHQGQCECVAITVCYSGCKIDKAYEFKPSI